MKIAFIVPGFSRDGRDWAIPALQTLAVSLAKEHELHVFSLRYPAAGRYLFQGITHHATGGGTKSGLASIDVVKKTVASVIQQHRQTPFDVLHAFWADEPGLTAAIVAARIHLPAVVTLAGGELIYLQDIGYGTQGSFLRRMIIRIALKRASAVTAGSLYQQRLARDNGLPTQKIRVIPLGVDTERFQPGTIPDWRLPTIIQAASLTPIKRQSALLDILRLVKKRINNIRLIMAGSGPLAAELERLVSTYRLSDNVIWCRNVTHQDMPQLYHKGHLYLQTSLHEAQGMSVVEALASGLPILGTPVGLLPEVACQPASWSNKTLAQQVIRLLGEPEAYSELQLRSRKLVQDYFGLTRSAAAYARLYRAIL